jgi:hypothetical protein
LAFVILCRVHSRVGNTKQKFLVRGVLRENRNPNACRALKRDILNRKWLVEALFEAEGNLLDIGAAAHIRHKHGEFVAADAGQGIRVAELAFHAQRDFLQVEVADLVTMGVVDLLEAVQVDVDQSDETRRRNRE